jgi:valyl-tRNA synthetase
MPMSMRTQAHEIIRTWAFYTIAKSLYHTGDIPWSDTMICGFVLAKPGEKISKSKGNSGFTPQSLIDTYSADMIRYWSAGARLGMDTFFDRQEMQDASGRLITKLWNSSKFVVSHMKDFGGSIPEVILPIDRWLIEKTNQEAAEAKKWLDQYEIGLARKIIDDLFWKDLCDNYIEIAKERLYQPEVHGAAERKSAQYALFYCFINVLKMYAPYIPHLTEYIYQKGFRDLLGAKSIHLTLWEIPESVDKEIIEFGEEFKKTIADMRKYKTENGLSMNAPIDSVTVKGTAKYEDWLRKTEKDLIACSKARRARYILS